MKNISNNSLFKKASVLRIINLTIILAIFLSISFLIPNSNNITEIDNDFNDFSQIPLLADADSVLFEGNENPLNITDYGNLYKYEQQVAVSNQESVNLSYYLDDVHYWEASQIDNSIFDIQETRNWVNNSGFKSPTIFREYRLSQTTHPYSPNHPISSLVDTIIEGNNATYMRAHFVDIGFERFYDYFYILDEYDQIQLITDTFSRSNVYSPWIPGDTMKFTYSSDSQDQFYGYYMDYYEYINASSNYDINSDTWGFNYAENGVSGTNTYGAGECGNATGMYVGLYGEYNDYFDFDYTNGAFSELYQNITIPRGFVKDAYISFDYNVPFGYRTNNNFIYCKINNKKVYSKGMGDIIDAGKNKWHSTGKIYMDLWANASPIFDGLLNDQKFNISVGIMSGNSVRVSYFEEAYQNIVWFDNISVVVTATANSTQSDINLKLNGLDLTDGNDWGISQKNITDTWETNPIILNFSTTSPDLSFNLDTTIYGNLKTQSKVGQTTLEGVSFEILENGSVYWYFSHNFFMPSQYTDFEFIVNKPLNWEFIYALDPTLQSRFFENGALGDSDLKINKANALFPGWWTFKATSSNYLDILNTMMLKQGEWTHTSFSTGESTRIKTQVNYSGEIPDNLESTEVNLTIFDPEGNQWYSEVKSPLSNGTVLFSEITLSALNTTGGQFEYTLFWSNGTALGGLKSSFIVNHYSQIKLLKPDDAKIDLRTDGFVGDIIPVRIILTDPENGLPISDAIISYTWPGGTTHNFTEAANGIYEMTLDTADLSSRGLYEIIISSSKLGFIESNLTLELNLGEEFDLVWIIIIISALIISALGIMSLRSYVILPRRRKREAELLARTQRFKDIQNIQAIVAIHKDTGIPLYTKSYSILEKHKKEIFSGFIQAIITVGEEIAGRRGKDGDLFEFDDEDGSRTILELDFKYFYCLICDRQDLRIVFILTERASDRMKRQISDLSLGAMLELSEQIENWDGAIHEFESKFPPIINNYLELYFKETFTINNTEFIVNLRKESELNSMETRILNVLYSIAKSKREFYLETIFDNIHEKNKDIVIDGIEALIKKQIIIPSIK